MNDTPLSPWVVVEQSGNIMAAHCNCMAGLGESCSHIGAILFYVEFAVRVRDSKTCTEEKAYWLLPGYRTVEYKEVVDVDFSAPKTLQKKLNSQAQQSEESKIPQRKSCFDLYDAPSEEEMNLFFLKIEQCGSKPAILSTVPGFSKKYEPTLITDSYPICLSELYDNETVGMDYKELYSTYVRM